MPNLHRLVTQPPRGMPPSALAALPTPHLNPNLTPTFNRREPPLAEPLPSLNKAFPPSLVAPSTLTKSQSKPLFFPLCYHPKHRASAVPHSLRH
ncbi:unnamed protein product [Sphenostylis stenocarpa]|uniref:Uncharacterized protein n=1 Tax=Sphenostylis stenocarpa TaxID=92480 RepID=A0AA86VR26_9FABA|nr:unnamed protein product [Sphenostylis stenocarpa]